MCRSAVYSPDGSVLVAERRCPGNCRVDRRRAYQRGRYAARPVEDERDASASPAGASGGFTLTGLDDLAGRTDLLRDPHTKPPRDVTTPPPQPDPEPEEQPEEQSEEQAEEQPEQPDTTPPGTDQPYTPVPKPVIEPEPEPEEQPERQEMDAAEASQLMAELSMRYRSAADVPPETRREMVAMARGAYPDLAADVDKTWEATGGDRENTEAMDEYVTRTAAFGAMVGAVVDLEYQTALEEKGLTDKDVEGAYVRAAESLGLEPDGTLRGFPPQMQEQYREMLDKELEPIRQARTALRREMYAAEIKRLRGEEGATVPDSFTFTRAVRPDDRAVIAEAVSLFPASMVAAAEEAGRPVRVRKTSQRAHFISARKTYTKNPVSPAMYLPIGQPQGGRYRDDDWRTRRGAEYVTRMDDGSDVTPEILAEHEAGRMTIPATDEGREKLEKIIAARAAMTESHRRRYTPPGRKVARSNWDGAEIVEVTHPETGEKHLAVRSWDDGHEPGTEYASGVESEITTNGTLPTTVHEMCHYVEDNNDRIGAATKHFVASRGKGRAATQYLNTRSEYVVADGFIDQYVGKQYADSPNATEVLSVGMEAMMTGRYGGLVNEDANRARKFGTDPEHRALVLGLLATA